MTKKIYTPSNYKPDRTRFGGLIAPSDFDRETTMSDVISRIVSDMKFDEQCRKNIKFRGIENGRK